MKLLSKTHVGDCRWQSDDVAKMKAMIVADFSELLNHETVEGLRWTSTKTDLVELSHLVWETGLLLDARGIPLSFCNIVRRICRVLNVVPPANPSGVLDKIRARKNIRVRPIVERYMLLYHHQRILHPMRLDIKRRSVAGGQEMMVGEKQKGCFGAAKQGILEGKRACFGRQDSLFCNLQFYLILGIVHFSISK